MLLKGYAFTFRPEPADYVPEPDFIPFVWDQKVSGSQGEQSMEAGGLAQCEYGFSMGESSGPSSMAIDPSPSHTTGHSHEADVRQLLGSIALTLINPKPTTPPGIEIARRYKVSGGSRI